MNLYTNHEYLNYHHLRTKLDLKIEQLRELKLENLNKTRAILAYKNRISLLDRFKNLIATEDISRIKQLASTCLKNGSGIKSIINKINLATSNLYEAKKWDQNDIDLATMVLRIGGPALLHIFSVKNMLPSDSFIYKSLKNKIKISFSYETPIRDCINNNIHNFTQNCTSFYSIKLDEIALSPRIRWSTKTNEFNGFCYNHKKLASSLVFNNYFNLIEVIKLYEDNRLHISREALCITIGKIDSHDIVPYPLAIVPICSHDFLELKNIFILISELFSMSNPNSTLINIATDGDHFRRMILNEMRREALDPYTYLVFSQMKYFNKTLILGKLSVNFDAKHLIKRIRGILISDSRSITLSKRMLTKKHIELLYPDLSNLMNPSDYQNVPYAVNLLSELTKRCDSIEKLSNHLVSTEILNELKILCEVIRPILNIFVNPSISLQQQLTDLSHCAHLLFFYL